MRRAAVGIERRSAVTFHFDGVAISAPEGEMLAAALVAAGVDRLRRNPVDGSWRGPFCHMGLCQECIVELGGVHVEACATPVAAGMQVRSVGTSGGYGV